MPWRNSLRGKAFWQYEVSTSINYKPNDDIACGSAESEYLYYVTPKAACLLSSVTSCTDAQGVACDEIPQNLMAMDAAECMSSLMLKHLIQNEGPTCVTLTNITREIVSTDVTNKKELIGLLGANANTLYPGESVLLTETEEFDRCNGFMPVSSSLQVEAYSVGEIPCTTFAEYEVLLNPV